mgnify:CR=1 FL=1
MAWNDIIDGESGAQVRSKINDLGNSNETKITEAPEDGKQYSRKDSGWEETSDDRATWMLSTYAFTAPIIAYQTISVDINSSGSISPIVIGGTLPFTSYQVVAGSLPSEFALDAVTGVIDYTTGATTSAGSFSVSATNPAGTSDLYEVQYSIQAAQGVEEATNSLNKYPALRVSTFYSTDDQPLIKADFFGTVVGSGAITENAAYPVYVGSNGDGTFNYLINRSDSTYWYFFKDCATDPHNLIDGLLSDINTSRPYDLVAPNSQDVTVAGVNYPSDATDVHYITAFNYMNVASDASLNGFMADGNDWSFGFRLQEDIPLDGLGRVLFSRRGRNWLGFYLGHNSTYTNLLYGNGASTSYTGESSFPASGFTAGQYVRCTYDEPAGKFDLYVDGTLYFSYNSLDIYFDDAASTDSLELDFGYAVGSNGYQTNYTYYHALWQGTIDRMWIANGTVISTDDNGTSFPVGTTHSWLLDEVSGSTFAANTGGVAITAETVTV